MFIPILIATGFFVFVIFLVIFLVYSESSPVSLAGGDARPQIEYKFPPRPDDISSLTEGRLVFRQGQVIRLENSIDGAYATYTATCLGGGNHGNLVVSPDVSGSIGFSVGVEENTTNDGFQVIRLRAMDQTALPYVTQCNLVDSCCGLTGNVVVSREFRENLSRWVVYQVANVNLVRLRNLSTGLYLTRCIRVGCTPENTTLLSNIYAAPEGLSCEASWVVHFS